MRTLFILFILTCAGAGAYAQKDSISTSRYEGLTLQDLLTVKIVSVSKKSELLFDAPLSASVVTREDIQRMGCNSIMEALRLVPGMIVQEQTNGNYDIYLRGMSNVPPNAPFEGNSTTTLVMIDNRPIYNYLKGGTFWETLPIDLNDVEKIEVIRGPAAALYGPNAVSGVINIITRKLKKEGLNLTAHAAQGSYNTFINNASIGYRWKKWSIEATGNYQHRNRTQRSYYEINSNRWLEDPAYMVNIIGDTVRNLQNVYPDQQLAMEKYAGNIFVGYDVSDDIRIDFSTGIQHSLVQKVSTDNGYSPLATVASDSRYADLRMHIRNLSAQISYNKGTQIPDHQPGNKYDFMTLDAALEYNHTIGNFSLKPGLNYRSAVYDDTPYSDTLNKKGIFNSKGKITTLSPSMRAEWSQPDERLRLIAGVMANKFNYPDTLYLSYEFAATYKLNKKHLLRAVYSRAIRSANIYDTYVTQRIFFYQTGVRNYTQLSLESNKQLQLLTADMVEVGYRGTLAPGLHLDVEVFNIHSKNYSMFVAAGIHKVQEGVDTISISPYVSINIPASLDQRGITLSLIYNKGKFQVNPFVTIQYSSLKDYSLFSATPDAPPSPQHNNPVRDNIYSGMGTRIKSRGTPGVFGGATLNYAATSKLNIGMNLYYCSAQVYYHASNTIFNDGVRGVDHLNAKLVVNLNLTYEPVKRLRLFCTGKNLLNNKAREFFQSDKIPFMLMGGIHYEL